ncbi:MAG: GAF domain-containing protein [Deltaproteobacteria bacterium]|nr:GAF domain-containing protein [Deltaproteobacteria bacterium]
MPESSATDGRDDLERQLTLAEKRMASIREIGAAIGSTLDLDRLLSLVMSKTTELMEADRSTLFLLDDEKQELWSKVLQGTEFREIRVQVGEGLAGAVAKSGRTLNIKDAYKDPRFNQEWDRRSGFHTRSVLCQPMKNTRGRLIGVIQVLNKKDGYFTVDDESLLAAITAQAAVSIENSKLYLSVVSKNIELLETQEKLKQKMGELDLLYETEREISRARSLEELLDSIIAKAMTLLNVEAGSVLLLEEGRNQLYFKSALGEKGEEAKKFRVQVGEGIVGCVVEKGAPLIVNQADKDPRHSSDIAARIGFTVRNAIAVPLASDGKIIGALELLNKRGVGATFSSEDLKILTLISVQANRAIDMALRREEAEKADRLATIGQMLSGVIHDFKTPMTIISGYVQLLAREEEPKEREEFSGAILKQLDMLSNMTRELLAFARGESNILIRRVFLHKFVEEMEEYLRPEFRGKGISFDVALKYRGVAYMDENKMKRIFYNISRNAIEAMPNGGRFEIRVECDGTNAVFLFSDSGGGVPDEIAPRLFDSFVTHGKKGGTGLGLAIVKKFADEHNGSVAFESTLGVGTTFTVKIPVGAEVSPEDKTIEP